MYLIKLFGRLITCCDMASDKSPGLDFGFGGHMIAADWFTYSAAVEKNTTRKLMFRFGTFGR